MEKKSTVRISHKQKRDLLEDTQVAEYSDIISRSLIEKILQIEDLKDKGVLAYFPLGKEVSLIRLYQVLLQHEIPLSFPKVMGKDIQFFQIHSFSELSRGCFGVLEPDGMSEPAVWENAVCLVPGVVFDETGGRYGYGKGYYDRFLQKNPDVRKIGIAYESQMEAMLVTDAADIYMNEIVTEYRWIHCRERRQ